MPKNRLDVHIVSRPSGPGEALKEFLADGVFGVGAWLRGLFEDFRRADRFLKFKVGIVGAWVALSAVTFVVTCQGGPVDNLEFSNAIGAFATYAKTDLNVPVLFIENHSGDRWQKVQLTVNETYSTLLPFIDAGGRAVVEIKKFNGPQGKTPPPDLPVRKLEINCSEGKAVLDLSSRR